MTDLTVRIHPSYQERVNEARSRMNATPWWRFLKRQSAAVDYKTALFAGAMADFDEKRTVAECEHGLVARGMRDVCLNCGHEVVRKWVTK